MKYHVEYFGAGVLNLGPPLESDDWAEIADLIGDCLLRIEALRAADGTYVPRYRYCSTVHVANPTRKGSGAFRPAGYERETWKNTEELRREQRRFEEEQGWRSTTA